MNTAQQIHDELVQEFADSYRAKGYLVDAGALVDADVHADLVARNGHETVLLEVRLASIRNESAVSLERLAQIAESKGWRFVIAISGQQGVDEIEIPTEAAVRSIIEEARTLPDGSRASVLVTWSAFEAAVRYALTRTNNRPRKGTAPQTLIQQVAALGLIDSQEERQLLRFGAERNQLAHGFESSVDDTAPVLAIADRLLQRQDA